MNASSTNNSLNTFSTPPIANTFTIGIAIIPISVIGVIGSLACLAFIFKHLREHHATTNLLFGDLAVATLLLCGFSLPMQALTMAKMDNLFVKSNHIGFCQAVAYIHWISWTACPCAQAAIAIYRFLSVIFIKHKLLISSRLTAFALIACTWLVPLLTFVFPLFNIFGSYGYSLLSNKCLFTGKIDRHYIIVYKTVNSFGPLAIMVLCYGVVVIKVYQSNRRLGRRVRAEASSASGAPQQQQRQRNSAELRTTKISATVCATFLACFIPWNLFGVLKPDIKDLQSTLGQSLTLIVYAGKRKQGNSGWMLFVHKSSQKTTSHRSVVFLKPKVTFGKIATNKPDALITDYILVNLYTLYTYSTKYKRLT